MLTTLGDILGAAQRDGYAVGAFDLVSLETGRALLDAAESRRSPIILMIDEEARSLLSYAMWMPALRQMASSSSVPVAISLDHGTSPQAVLRAIEAGATGVMFDGSQLPLEENIRLTAQIARMAHTAGVSLEAEVGHVGEAAEADSFPPKASLTEPAEAARFVEATGVDVLAVAIGTAHGQYRRPPQIDFERLAAIRRRVGVPLVLHGGSGTPPDSLRRCVQLGICKVNIYTDMVQRAAKELRASQDRGDDLLDWLRAINTGFSQVAASYIDIFGSAGRAAELV